MTVVDFAPRAIKRVDPPTYITIHTSIDIDPWDLEQAGWVYVGTDDEGDIASADTLQDLIVQVHNDEHDGPIRWCRHRLCEAVARVAQ